jgi:sulfane dehydrogenase subunit SoxC
MGGAAGMLTLAQVAMAHAVTPQGQTAPPQAHEDSAKAHGQLPSPVGSRSPFEGPRRLVTGSTASRTPLDALDGIITPADSHYERHHGGVPTIDSERHVLLIYDMVDRPTVFSLADLRRFPSVSRIISSSVRATPRGGRRGPTPTAGDMRPPM